MNNILITVSDALRKDHPCVEEFSQGAVYEGAWSCGSATIPAFASLFTGQLPHIHGANAMWVPPLNRDLWMDRRLEAAGYNVLVVTENPFTKWSGVYLGDEDRNWHIHGEGFNYIADNLPPEPWAVFYHSMVTHFPYGNKGQHLQKHIRLLTPEVKDELYDHYLEGGYMFVDQLMTLEHEIKPDVSIVTSDHGEGFLERGFYGHPMGRLWGFMVNIPLVVRDGRATRHYSNGFSMKDFPELVLKAAAGTRTVPQSGAVCRSEGYRGKEPRVVCVRIDNEVAFRYPKGIFYYKADDYLGDKHTSEHPNPEMFEPHLKYYEPAFNDGMEHLNEDEQEDIARRLRDLGYID